MIIGERTLVSAIVVFMLGLLFVTGASFSQAQDNTNQVTEESYVIDPPGTRAFGRTIMSSGNTLIISSMSRTEGNLDYMGRLYIYEKDSEDNLVLVQSLRAIDIDPVLTCGRAAISGDTIAWNCLNENIPSTDAHRGTIYVFERNEGVWSNVDVLTSSDGHPFADFGSCLSVSGDTILTSTSFHTIGESEQTGQAYIFEKDQNGDWNETILQREAPLGGEFFGFDCALDGDIAIIGAPAWNEQRGFADIYEKNEEGNWNQVHRVTRTGGEFWDQLGKSVDISGDTAIVGIEEAYKLPCDPFPFPTCIVGVGSAFILERDQTGAWSQTELTPSDVQYGKFGTQVDISGNKVLVGAYGTTNPNGSEGRTYQFEKGSDGTWTETDIFSASDGRVLLFGGNDVEIFQNINLISTTVINGDIEVLVYLQEPDFNLLPLDPSEAGVLNTFSAINATPGGDVTFLWGFNEGSDDGSSLCDGLEVGILNFNNLTTVSADDSGVASFDVFVPTNFAGLSVVLQAVDLTMCTASNVNQETIANPAPPAVFTFEGLSPSLAGLQNNLTINDGTPNGDITFIWDFADTAATSNSTKAAGDICPGFETSISNPKVLVTLTADENGDASYMITVPESFAGLSVVLQAVDITSCTGSNITTETIGEFPGPLVLSPLDPSIGGPGIVNSYTVNNALPGAAITLFFSIEEGTQMIPECPQIILDSSNATQIDTEIADESGNVDGGVTLGGSTPGDFLPVFFQAVDLETCQKSNLVEQLF